MRDFKRKYGFEPLDMVGKQNGCPHYWVETGQTFNMEKYDLGIYTTFWCIRCGMFTAIDKALGQNKPKAGPWGHAPDKIGGTDEGSEGSGTGPEAVNEPES